MSSDPQSGFQAPFYKSALSGLPPLGWLKTRVRDVMVAAEVLHHAQWDAPWRDDKSVRPDA